MRTLKHGLAFLLMLLAFNALVVHAAPEKTATNKKATKVAKKKNGKNANKRIHVALASSSKVAADSRITATRKLLAQEQGHSQVSYLRGSAKLAPITFPEFVPPSNKTTLSGKTTYSVAQQAGLDKTTDPLSLSSSAVYILDQSTFGVLFQKNANVALPMASITKLMTGLVIVESMQDMSEIIEITKEDASKAISSRLKVGTKTTRGNLLHLALMSSENRAAAALGRHYPGGYTAFVAAMNTKARALGMTHTHYVDTTGLSSNNVASAQDLAHLVIAAAQYPILKQFSTDTGYVVNDGLKPVHYANTNRLVHNPNMNIELQKTGFISAAGSCLVMQAIVEERPIIMVFLDAKGKESRIEDVLKMRNWIQRTNNTNNNPQV